MDCSFPFAGFFEKKSENTQKKYIRDAITQRETRNWVQERKNEASTQRETKNWVQERKIPADKIILLGDVQKKKIRYA